MSRAAGQELPAKYYLPQALEMFATVSRYGHLLTPAQQDLIANFYLLDEQAQCLFLRMASRQHDLIKKESLEYAEVTQLPEALRCLQFYNFSRAVKPQDWPQLLRVLNKPQLQAVLQEDHDEPVKASLSKARLLALCEAQQQNLGSQARLLCDDYVVRCKQGDLQYLNYLFNGKFDACLRLYSPQGQNSYAGFGSRLGVRFDNREQAMSAFEFARATSQTNHESRPLRADDEYAVVDIETTGGRAASHRITEVAVVKVRGGELVGQWSTLVNPEQRIPPMITELTGITEQMVAGAPPFADIAEELEKQLSGCIFVAHNVSFDYGFIGTELARAGRCFTMPRCCTVRETRARFPGLPSYSLANLCQQFQVNLGQHHRALDDALAAAQILLKNLRHDQQHEGEMP